MAVAPAADNGDDSEEDSDASGEEEDEMDMNTSSEQHRNQIMSSPDNAVTVVVDRWLKFQSTALDVAQIYCLRERLAEAILFKVKSPSAVLPPALAASMHAITCILSLHSLPRILSTNESTDDPQAPNFPSTDMNTIKLGRTSGPIVPSAFLKSLMSNNGRQFSQNLQKAPGFGLTPHLANSSALNGPSHKMIQNNKPFVKGTPFNPNNLSSKRHRGSMGGGPRWG